MILLAAVVVGIVSGFLRAKLTGRSLQNIKIRSAGLVIAAFLPQFFAFYYSGTRATFPDRWVPVVLIGSQVLLLVFVWRNRRLPGFWLLGLGLLANFLVISLNGGMMPLLPGIAARLIPAGSPLQLIAGQRVGFGKDILLEKADTRLWFLGDIFLLPAFFNYPLAFSIGDILISAGAFWLLWSLGSPRQFYSEGSP